MKSRGGNYMNFKMLIQSLEAEVDIYKKFEEIEETKTSAIVNGDIEKLDEILTVEQMLHMKVQSLEKKRIETMRNLNLDGKTLIDVIELAESEDKEKLSEIYDELNFYIDSIKQINEYNTKLVKSRLDIISVVTEYLKEPAYKAPHNMGNFTKITGKLTYGKDAKVSNHANEFEPAIIRKRV